MKTCVTTAFENGTYQIRERPPQFCSHRQRNAPSARYLSNSSGLAQTGKHFRAHKHAFRFNLATFLKSMFVTVCYCIHIKTLQLEAWINTQRYSEKLFLVALQPLTCRPPTQRKGFVFTQDGWLLSDLLLLDRFQVRQGAKTGVRRLSML